MKQRARARRAARRLFRLSLVEGIPDDARVRRVARRLAGSRHRGSLAILSDFHRWLRLDRERRTAVVESAAVLPADLRQEVAAGLAHRYGRGLMTSFAENRGLIAGMRIRVGSDVYEGSVRGRLEALEARFEGAHG